LAFMELAAKYELKGEKSVLQQWDMINFRFSRSMVCYVIFKIWKKKLTSDVIDVM